MLKQVAAWSLLIATLAIANEPVSKPSKPPTIQVECHGKLRHGVVAAGGETTGTTITFEGLTWELNLLDEPTRQFAIDHHKKQISAVGSLRRTKGVEKSTRWIVDVERLSERAANPKTQGGIAPVEGAALTVSGTLKTQHATAGRVAAMELEVDGITWPLDLGEQHALQAKAVSLAGQPVTIKGNLVFVKDADAKSPPTLRVDTIDPVAVEKHKP